MQTPLYRRIALKIGSNVLTRPDGTLDITTMSALVDQVALLRKATCTYSLTAFQHGSCTHR